MKKAYLEHLLNPRTAKPGRSLCETTFPPKNATFSDTLLEKRFAACFARELIRKVAAIQVDQFAELKD